MNVPLEGPLATKVVVVTGAARGIGRGISAELAAQGAAVIGLDREPVEGVVRSVKVDLTDAKAVAQLSAQLAEEHPRLDALVNNAGISRRADLSDLTEDTWRAVHDINLWAAVRLTRTLRPLLRNGASIVNVTSIRASVAFAGDTAYIASKGGLQAATRALAVELGPAGIRVNAVAPGAIETELNREALADPAYRAKVSGRIPLGRLGTPADVAFAVAFLVGDQSRWIAGSTLTVDGGQSAFG